MKLKEYKTLFGEVGYGCPYCDLTVRRGSITRPLHPEKRIFKGSVDHTFLICPKCKRKYSLLDGEELNDDPTRKVEE